jgi:flagellar P-ring protein FlgI
MRRTLISLLQSTLVLATLLPELSGGARIKDLATLEGVRDNQLIGYGLVVGLNGTGDKRQTFFSTQTLSNLLQRMGVQVAPTAIQVRNTASVMLTANLPPFAQPGSRLDVTVAAIGDATNLQGGLLILTPLKSATGAIYAVAQGSVLTGGFSAKGAANSTTVNHPTAGRVPSGAIVEQAAPSVLPGNVIRLQLRQADFTTASRVAQAINKKYAASIARCENADVVAVETPADQRGRTVEFIADFENLLVDADRAAKVVINERTGTIVLGKEVQIHPIAILHGNLGVEIQTRYDVSQPEAFSKGTTTVTPETNVGVKEEKARQLVLKQGATVEELVKALTSIGSTPRDVIAILQNLRAAGALEAELETI